MKEMPVAKIRIMTRLDKRCCYDYYDNVEVRVGNVDANDSENKNAPMTINTACDGESDLPSDRFFLFEYVCKPIVEGKIVTVQLTNDDADHSFDVSGIEVFVTADVQGSYSTSICDSSCPHFFSCSHQILLRHSFSPYPMH